MNTVFVGRSRELAALEGDLDDAARGRGRLVLVAGEPGIGKTRLAERVATLAEQRGFAVHWGRCWHGGGAPAFWPWTQLLRSLRMSPDLQGPALDGGIEAAIDRLARSGTNDAGADPSASAERERFDAFDAVTALLASQAGRSPQLLVLDDLHDADDSSLLLLRFVARELLRQPLLLLATHREAEIRRTPERLPLFASLVRDGRRLVLGGLGRTELVELISARGASMLAPPTREALCEICGGNPFFADEMLRAALARSSSGRADIEIPYTVREMLRERLRPLRERPREALEAAATLGREFEARHVAEVVGVDAASCHAALETCAVEGLVERLDPDGCHWRFVHVLIRESCCEDIEACRKRELHRRAADALRADREAGLVVHASAVAHHSRRAWPLVDRDDVVEALVESAREALRCFAFEEAAVEYGRALALLEPARLEDAAVPRASRLRFVSLLLECATAQRWAGPLARARRSFRRAAALLEPFCGNAERSDAEPALFARAVLGFGAVSETGRVDEELVALLEKALVVLGDGEAALRASVTARLAMALYFSTETERCLAASEQALGLAREAGDAASRMDALVARHLVLWRPGTACERLSVADALVTLCGNADRDEKALEARLWRIADLLELGQLARVDRERRLYDAAAEASRLPVHRWHAAMLRAAFAAAEGRHEEALHEADAARAIGVEAGLPNAEPFHLAQRFQVLQRGGRSGEIASALHATALAVPAMPIWSACAAEALLEAGKAQEAKRIFDLLAMDGFGALARDGMWLPTMAVLSRVAFRLGDAARAAQIAALLGPYEEAWVPSVAAITIVGPLRLFLGILAAACGDAALATRHLEDAAQRCRAAGFAGLVAECDAWLLRARRPSMDGCLSSTDVSQPSARPAATALSASASSSPTPPGSMACEFRRAADYWTVAAGGIALRLRDSKGLRYIHFLLEHPEREFHVFELVSAVEGAPSAQAGQENAALGRDTGPLLDAAAIADYRRRLRELECELAEAERHHDGGRIERLAAEREFLLQELRSAVGLGGRKRRGGAPSEQLRVRVTKVIALALRRIAAADAALGRLLSRGIRTGTFCAYLPDPDRPIDWLTSRQNGV